MHGLKDYFWESKDSTDQRNFDYTALHGQVFMLHGQICIQKNNHLQQKHTKENKTIWPTSSTRLRSRRRPPNRLNSEHSATAIIASSLYCLPWHRKKHVAPPQHGRFPSHTFSLLRDTNLLLPQMSLLDRCK